MRKIILGVIVIGFIIALLSMQNKDPEIRVRVIPNSDQIQDLKIKEEAKEMVICYLKQGYSPKYETFISNINLTKDELEKTIEKELLTDCTVTFGKHTLYNKTYNSSAVENSEAMTLYVMMGIGKGANWWGTVYPDFLQISSSEETKYESLIVHIFQKIKGEQND